MSGGWRRFFRNFRSGGAELRDLFPTSRSAAGNFRAPRAVLVQAPGWGVNTPPLALALLTAFLRRHGHRVLPLDLNLELHQRSTEEFRAAWSLEKSLYFWGHPSRLAELLAPHREYLDRVAAAIVATGAPMVGFTAYSSALPVSLLLARKLKERNPRVTVVFGGPEASRNLSGNALARESCVDLVVQGEGELTLLEIVQRLERGDGFADCPGLLSQAGDRVIDTGDRDVIADLDSLPFADFTDFDFSRYREPFKLPMMSSRGCLNRCLYCNERPYWGRYRTFSARRLFAEVREQLRRAPGPDWIEFQDSLVNGSIPELEAWADLVIASGLRLRWCGQAVIRPEMTAELFAKLKRSGCVCLAFGLETASPGLMLRVGKRLSRGTDPDRLVREAHQAGLTCAYNFMFGLPGETAADHEATLAFVRRNRERLATVNPSPTFCGFAPGTLGFAAPDRHGLELRHGGLYWSSPTGENTFLTRVERFESFCRLVAELKIPTTYPSPVLLDRDRQLFMYYYATAQLAEAVACGERCLRDHPADRQVAELVADCRRRLANP